MKSLWSKFRGWFGRRSKIGKLLVLICLLFLCAAIGSLFDTEEGEGGAEIAVASTPLSTWTPSPTRTRRPTVTATATLSPQAHLEAIIAKALGASNREVDRGVSVDIIPTDKGNEVYVEWNINDNFSDASILRGALRDVLDIGEALKKSGLRITTLDLVGSFVMVDKYGNHSEDPVLTVTFEAETLSKINWDGMLIENVPNVADHIWVHAAFN